MIDASAAALLAAAHIVETRGLGSGADMAVREALGISARRSFLESEHVERRLGVYERALSLLAGAIPRPAAGSFPRFAVAAWSDALAALGDEGAREAAATMHSAASFAEAPRGRTDA